MKCYLQGANRAQQISLISSGPGGKGTDSPKQFAISNNTFLSIVILFYLLKNENLKLFKIFKLKFEIDPIFTLRKLNPEKVCD